MSQYQRLPFPQQRGYERGLADAEYEALREDLKKTYTPNVLYRGILFWVLRQAKKEGLAYFAFVDLFGGKPSEADRAGGALHLEDPDFEKWMYLRGERSRRQWRNQKARARKKKNASASELE